MSFESHVVGTMGGCFCCCQKCTQPQEPKTRIGKYVFRRPFHAAFASGSEIDMRFRVNLGMPIGLARI